MNLSRRDGGAAVRSPPTHGRPTAGATLLFCACVFTGPGENKDETIMIYNIQRNYLMKVLGGS